MAQLQFSLDAETGTGSGVDLYLIKPTRYDNDGIVANAGIAVHMVTASK